MRVMSGTLLMPVWTRRSWMPWGLISHKRVFGKAGESSDMIKPMGSRTKEKKVGTVSFNYSCRDVLMSHASLWVYRLIRVYCMCSSCALCAVIILSLSHDVPIHASPLPDAFPRPVSLSQPTSFQPISLPVQSLPKWGAFQRSPPGVPRVQACSGIQLFPWALPHAWLRFRLWLPFSTALAA